VLIALFVPVFALAFTMTAGAAPSASSAKARLALVKSANIASYDTVGTVITYTFRVTNTGTQTVTHILVADPLVGLSAISCAPNSNPIASLAAAASATCTAHYTVTAADVKRGSIANTATAKAKGVSASGSLTLPELATTSALLTKSANVQSFTQIGQLITYSFKVTNTGSTTLTNLVVADPMAGLSPIKCPPNNNSVIPTLAPGQSVTCTATYVVTALNLKQESIANTATVSEKGPAGNTVLSNSNLTIPGKGQPFGCESPSPSDFLTQTNTGSVTTATPTNLWSTVNALGTYFKLGPPLAPSGVQHVYNALAYDPLTDFLYATAVQTNQIVKIDSSGTVVTHTAILPHLPTTISPNVGAFDGIGRYWVTQSNSKTYYSVTTAGALSAPKVFHPSIGGRGWQPADWALFGTINAANTNYLWGLEGKYIFRVDLAPGVNQGKVDSWASPAQVQAVGAVNGTFGAAWTFSNGNLGFSNNRTGDIFELSVTNPASNAPTISYVAEEPATTGPPLGSTVINDGAACIGKATNLSITKTLKSVSSNGDIIWAITVTNNGPQNSSGFVVNDVVPAPIINVGSSTPGCTVAGNDIQCIGNTLQVGNSTTILVTGQFPAHTKEGTCVTNKASMIPDEPDTNPVTSAASKACFGDEGTS
jgi:uncharacterized repeat protein (TIGR01451 family)